jgi:MutS domain V
LSGCDNGSVQSPSPNAEYSRRLSAIAESTARHKRRDDFFAATKLIVGLLIVLLAIWLVKYHATKIFFLLVPILLFVILAVLHERVLHRLRECARLRAYYERGISRIDNCWAGTGETGERFLDPAHPYTRDLDIFGPASLFQLLCTARTSSGEETLAAWLQTAASAPEIAARQAAVQELTPCLDFREKLVLAGEEAKAGIHPGKLTDWAEAKQSFNRTSIRILAIFLTSLWLASLAAWWKWDWISYALFMSVVNFGVSYTLRKKVNSAAAGVDGAQHDLVLLAAILKLIEDEPFTASRFAELQSSLTRSGIRASQAIDALSRRVAWFDSRHNWFIRICDPFVFWTPHWVTAIEAWRDRHGAAIREWLAVTGEAEALSALAVYAYEHPADTFPQFIDGGPYLNAHALAHPLLSREKSVPNELNLDSDLQLLVISGPNMAGKSTFIRCVGVNTVLALCGAPVRATSLRLSPLAVAASICVLDSLSGGTSRFYAEIRRLKLAEDLAAGTVPVLFLMDELLSGTNSHDRLEGTRLIVRSLVDRGSIGIVSTHDLALAEIPDSMGGRAVNFHFEDRLEDGKLIFEYKLQPGVVKTSNALELMRSIGLGAVKLAR